MWSLVDVHFSLLLFGTRGRWWLLRALGLDAWQRLCYKLRSNLNSIVRIKLSVGRSQNILLMDKGYSLATNGINCSADIAESFWHDVHSLSILQTVANHIPWHHQHGFTTRSPGKTRKVRTEKYIQHILFILRYARLIVFRFPNPFASNPNITFSLTHSPPSPH